MVKVKQTAVRFSDEDLLFLDALTEKLGLTTTDVIRLAVRRLAELERVVLPKKKPTPKK